VIFPTDFESVLDALAAALASIVGPGPIVTRHFRDLAGYADTDQVAGVYTVLIGPRTGYNYEHRPGDLPRVTIWIYAEQRLDGDDPGPAIDAVENQMAAHLETLANQAPEVPELVELTLQSITPSAQTTPPVASVLGQFIYGVER